MIRDKLKATVTVPWSVLLLVFGVGGPGALFGTAWATEAKAMEKVEALNTRVSVMEADLAHIADQVTENSMDLKSVEVIVQDIEVDTAVIRQLLEDMKD